MNFRLRKLSILSQLLLFLIPIITLFVCLVSYISYTNAIDNLEKREADKKISIINGVKLLINNHDLYINLQESKISNRFRYLSEEILSTYQTDIIYSNLDSVQNKLNMNPIHEDLYIINKYGIVENTTKKIDINFNLNSLGVTFQNFLKEVRQSKTLFIDHLSLEIRTNKPKLYAYQAIDDNYILEIGITSPSIDNIINKFNTKISNLSKQYSNIKSIDLFRANEAFISSDSNSVLPNLMHPLAVECFKLKKDTTITTYKNGLKNMIELNYINNRNPKYFDGYILQIISDDSLERYLFSSETKKFICILLITMALILLAIYYIAKRITQPIRYLVRKVSQISNQQEIERFNVRGNRETEYLSRKFDRMLTQIKGNEMGLKIKIEERTKELNSKNESLQNLLEERSLLIKEIHHRVKNNLQIISSLLNFQLRNIKNKEAFEIIESSKNRIQSMAIFHEKLYEKSNYVTINGCNYLKDLITVLNDTITYGIKISVNENNILLDSSQAISVGLITNEAVTNSIKHGFKSKKNAIILINLNQTKSHLTLSISNNGEKLTNYLNTDNENSIGLTIISAFTERLDGKYTLKNREEKGVILEVTFPKTMHA